MTPLAESIEPRDGDGGGEADPLSTFVLLLMRGAAGRGEFIRAAIQREIKLAFEDLAKETNQ
jgi:hypothetical protein